MKGHRRKISMHFVRETTHDNLDMLRSRILNDKEEGPDEIKKLTSDPKHHNKMYLSCKLESKPTMETDLGGHIEGP